MSPQTPFSNQSQQQLTKQSSISSIRDALLSGTNQLTPGEQHSPMTPPVKPTLSDGQIMSPMSVTRQDSQLSASESISSQDRFSQQPGLHSTENSGLSDSQDMNSVSSGQEGGGRPESLSMNSASLQIEHSSPLMNQAVSLGALQFSVRVCVCT